MFALNRLGLDSLLVMACSIFGAYHIKVLTVGIASVLAPFYIGLPSILRLLLGFCFLDFIYYWFHRIHHEVRPFWFIHEFHHSAEDMNMITGLRDHPVEKAFQGAVAYIPLLIIDQDSRLTFAFMSALTFHGMWLHSSLSVDYGIFQLLFVSPRYHQIHHSRLPEHIDCNYGVYLTVWDRLFGTMHKGPSLEPEFGTTSSYWSGVGLLDAFLIPVLKYCRATIRGIGQLLLGDVPS